MDGVSIESSRFVMRSLAIDDATDTYLGWFDDPDTKERIVYAAEEHTVEDLKEYIRNSNCDESIMLLGIFCKKKNSHIGNIRYESIDSVKQYAIMGILVGEQEWRGRGVATEVIKETSIWLRKYMSISRIFLNVDYENESAIKAYEKVGFIKVESEFITPDIKHGFSMALRI